MRVALIGAGRIFERHLSALEELAQLASVIAVVEQRADRRTAVEEKGIRAFSSVEEMMACHGEEIDMFSVLTESGSHKDLSLELLQYGKPVLVEKPLTLSVRDANELVDAFNKLEIPLFVVKQNRLNPPVARAFSDLKKGLLGELIFASATVLWARHPEYYLADTWRLTRDQDGGVVWNQASHYVDLLVQALGTVESVFAYGANFLSPAETEDTVFAVLKSKSGAIGSLQATTTIRPKNFEGSLILSGDGGLVKVGGHALNETVAATNTALEVDKEALESDSAEVYGKSHSRLYLDIFEDLEGKRDSGFRAADAIQVVAVMEAIHLSINTKSEVLVREILESAK